MFHLISRSALFENTLWKLLCIHARIVYQCNKLNKKHIEYFDTTHNENSAQALFSLKIKNSLAPRLTTFTSSLIPKQNAIPHHRPVDNRSTHYLITGPAATKKKRRTSAEVRGGEAKTGHGTETIIKRAIHGRESLRVTGGSRLIGFAVVVAGAQLFLYW